MTRPIFFLSDFGLTDTYVGVVKAVILSIAPDATIVDLTHDIPPQDVRAGAFALLTTVPYLPSDAVVLAVVDPGVGTARHPIAVEAGGRCFVGPDNGLLSWVVSAAGDTSPLPGGSAGACPPPVPLPRGRGRLPHPSPLPEGEGASAPRNRLLPLARLRARGLGGEGRTDSRIAVLDKPRFWLPTISASFHGRDLFGPVTAHLASGVPLDEVGSPLETMTPLPFPMPRREVDAAGAVLAVHGEVIHVDRYGNLITNLAADDLPPDPVVLVAGQTIVGLAPHFQAAASLIAMIGSVGLLEIAVPNGSAAQTLSASIGAKVDVRSR